MNQIGLRFGNFAQCIPGNLSRYQLRRNERQSFVISRLIQTTCPSCARNVDDGDGGDHTYDSRYQKLDERFLKPSKASSMRITEPLTLHFRKDRKLVHKRGGDNEPLLPWNKRKHRDERAAKEIIRENPSIDYQEPSAGASRYASRDQPETENFLRSHGRDDEYRFDRNRKGGYNHGLSGSGKSLHSNFEEHKYHLKTLEGEAVFGKFPCLMALQEGKREIYKVLVKKDYFQSSDPDRKLVQQLAEEKGIHIKYCHKGKLDILSQSRPHQGICLDASRLKPELLTIVEEEPKQRLDLLIHTVQDPMNLGNILRTSYYMGVDRIILTQFCCGLTAVVSKASAGVMEVMPMHSTRDTEGLVEAYKLRNWHVCGSSNAKDGAGGDDSKYITVDQIDSSGNVLLIIGSEGEGIPETLLNQCDQIVSIQPGRQLHPHLDSLNVSIATGVLLHRLASKRGAT